jgi:hypothetical protein
MLAFKGTDAPADARAFAAQGLGSYASFDFWRDAGLADGRKARAAFSLAFAIDPALPRLAFFTCHHHLPRRDLFLQPDYLRHANGAKRVVEVILWVPDPAAHRDFFERLTESEASTESGGLCFGPSGDRIVLLRHDDSAQPSVAAYRLEATDLNVVERQLKDGGVPYRATEGSIVVAPEDAFGVAIKFTTGESDDGNLDNGPIHSAHALAAAERQMIGLFALLPAAVDAVNVPVVGRNFFHVPYGQGLPRRGRIYPRGV